jgi:hypothetical protein
MSVRSSIPRSRLLTTLTSATPAASTLVPPYSHSQSIPQEPSPSLRPPYAHQSLSDGQRKVHPKLRYALVDRTNQQKEVEERYLAWASSIGEENIQKLWLDTLEGLQAAEGSGVSLFLSSRIYADDQTRVAEIPFHQLARHLATKSTIKDLKKIGIVVVRDVVLDADAQAAGEEIRSFVQARGGHAAYWHQYLLALRAHPSTISANSQIMSALTGKEARYIKADTLTGLASSRSQTVRFDKPWTVSSRNPHVYKAYNQSDQSLSAHIALSPSRPGAYRVTPSIHAARYAALRPFFRPQQSRISFYNKEGYLHPSNWTATTPRYSTEPVADLPHLTNSIDLPEIRAGDIIYSHSALPLMSAKPGGASDFLPVSPLGATSSKDVREQREAFEQGLPPPQVLVNGSVAIEEAGTKEALLSSGGRSTMGY